MVIILYLIGSIGSGKTTLAKMLAKALSNSFKIRIVYTHTHIYHGLAYVLLRFTTLILHYRKIVNYYLTIWFINPRFFKRLIRILLLLDVVSIPIVMLYRLVLPMIRCKASKDCIFIVDEGPINAIVEQLYYVSRSTNVTRDLISKALLSAYYAVLLYFVKWLLNNRTLLVFFKMPIIESVKVWIRRESTHFVDVEHIAFKKAGLTYILENVVIPIADATKVSVVVYDITEIDPLCRASIVKHISKFLTKNALLETK